MSYFHVDSMSVCYLGHRLKLSAAFCVLVSSLFQEQLARVFFTRTEVHSLLGFEKHPLSLKFPFLRSLCILWHRCRGVLAGEVDLLTVELTKVIMSIVMFIISIVKQMS